MGLFLPRGNALPLSDHWAGHWEDNNTKNHDEWPKTSRMATDRRLISRNQRLIATNRRECVTILRLGLRTRKKPVILKPVGRMSFLGEFDLAGVVLGCFLGRPFCASKQGLQAPGCDEDDWVYCDCV